MGYNPSYKCINPTYPIYNWGYNPLTKWDEPPSRLFIYDERSVGGATVVLRIIQGWSDSILFSLLNNFKREDIFENQLISQRQL